ncbi:MAG: pyridoxamine 5'-phosphate oxidase family protein [Gemmatimonadaceae bacterium]
MNRSDLLAFMRSHAMAVQASVSLAGAPQAAVIGVVVTDRFEIFFDTLESTRKIRNLRKNPKVACVLGGLSPGEEKTVQYEGVADEPRGSALAALKALYLTQFPDGRERQSWPGIVYVRVQPTWLRYSDYGQVPAMVLELDAAQLDTLA